MRLAELLALLRSDLSRLCESPDQVAASLNWLTVLSPRFVPVILVRVSRYCYLSHYLKNISSAFTWLNLIVFGIEFTAKCEVGPGLLLPHTSGTVVGAIRIGRRATIYQGVTLGAKFADIRFTPSKRPVIGDSVTLGAGSKILGGISVGDGAVIAANSLVLENVDPNAVMMGVPAARYRKQA